MGPPAHVGRALRAGARHADPREHRGAILRALARAGGAHARVSAGAARNLRRLPGGHGPRLRGGALPLHAPPALLQPRPDRGAAASALPRSGEPPAVRAGGRALRWPRHPSDELQPALSARGHAAGAGCGRRAGRAPPRGDRTRRRNPDHHRARCGGAGGGARLGAAQPRLPLLDAHVLAHARGARLGRPRAALARAHARGPLGRPSGPAW